MKQLFDLASSSQPLSISNAFFIAHFKFARFLLDEICVLNSTMQEEFATLPGLWHSVLNFKNKMKVYFDEMKRNCFEKFEYIMPLNDSQKETFLNVMEMTILNLDKRFPCPSMSIDTHMAKRNVNETTRTLDALFYKSVQMKCPFVMEIDLFNFPDQFIRERKINEWFLRQFSEMDVLLKQIVENEKTIIEKAELSKLERQDVNTKCINLVDVFKVVDRTKFPVLWDIVLRVLSYTPTSVSCEQSFSILKRRMHENVKKENAFMFVEMAKRTKTIELLS